MTRDVSERQPTTDQDYVGTAPAKSTDIRMINRRHSRFERYFVLGTEVQKRSETKKTKTMT